MKQSFFIIASIVLLLCGSVAWGQETPDSQNRQWNIVEYNLGHYTNSVISTGPDTIINETLASRLYENGNYVGAYFTNDDKCFFEDSLGNTTLLYDYGLQPGDTAFWIPILDAFWGEEQYLIVDSISTAQVNGEGKKVLSRSRLCFPWPASCRHRQQTAAKIIRR